MPTGACDWTAAIFLKEAFMEVVNTADQPGVDIEKIMEEIREDIRKRELDGSLLPFEEVPNVISSVLGADDEFDEKALGQNVDIMSRTYQVPLDRPLESRKAGKLGVFIKRAVRALTRFYISPVVTDQDAYNEAVCRAAMQIQKHIQNQEKWNHIQETTIKSQQVTITQLKRQIEELENKLRNETS